MSESKAQISARSREEILAALKKGFKIPNFKPRPSIDPVGHIKSSGDMLAEMKQKMSDNKFIVEECEAANLEAKINEITASYGYKKLIYPSNLQLNLDKINAESKVCFDKNVEDLRKEVFHSEFSIINARCGVSSHGVVCVLSSKEQPRMLSLAPTLCIILLRKEAVVRSMSEALNLVKAECLGILPNSSGVNSADGGTNSSGAATNLGGASGLNADSGAAIVGGAGLNGGIFANAQAAAASVADTAIKKAQANATQSAAGALPSNVLFIAGPSRTADIELITVFGVHGSQKVHLILY